MKQFATKNVPGFRDGTVLQVGASSPRTDNGSSTFGRGKFSYFATRITTDNVVLSAEIPCDAVTVEKHVVISDMPELKQGEEPERYGNN